MYAHVHKFTQYMNILEYILNAIGMIYVDSTWTHASSQNMVNL